MPRPSRTTVKPKQYAESSDSEENIDEDDSFDEEDDDPDKIEVPGGGKTLAAAVRGEQGQLPVMTLQPPYGNSVRQRKTAPSATVVKQEIPSASSSYGMGHVDQYMKQPGGGYNPYKNSLPAPSYLMSPLQFTSEGVQQSSPVNLNGLFGPNNSFISKFDPYLNPSTFQQIYNAILTGSSNDIDAYNTLRAQGLLNFLPGMNANPAGFNQPKSKPENAVPEAEDDNQEDEAMGVAETYADYKPAKLTIGTRHPDPVVETASMASVLPPDVTYKTHLPKFVVEKGGLSALQLEAVTYACQQHEFILPSNERAGYLIGDGAGVGKGRTIAGIIYENYLRGRKKAIWVSVSTDLKYDSERDLQDIGAKIGVVALNKLKYGKITITDGVIFSTYSSLIGESSQSGKFSTRLKQLLQWCGDRFDGVIVFDECHRAKNLCAQGSTKPTKTGLTVHELQRRLPMARIVYASATGASEPRNMAYMTRLGIWGPGTPFPEFMDFIHSVEKRGVGAMEIVAMDMKLRGAYIARQLSFQGVTFNIEEVPLAEDFIKTYDMSVELWVELMQRFIEATELMNSDKKQKKAIWAQFWSSHQRFFKYLCIAAKVPKVISIASEAVKFGKCVVIGLQSTGEARTLDQLEKDEGELTDFVSTAKGVLQALVEKHFPSKNKSSKVAKILEGVATRNKMWDEIMIVEPEPCTSSGTLSSTNKRKPVRRAAQKAVKRVKADSDDSDFDGLNADDSDFEMPKSGGSSESYMSESSSSQGSAASSEAESDEDNYGSSKKHKEKKAARGNSGTSTFPQALAPRKPSAAIIAKVEEMRQQLLAKIDTLGERLPPNALDHLIDELGGPDDVAEMTGRKGRVIQTEGGKIEYESRSEVDVSLETINLTEKQRFMDGVKKIAIISEAASSGISLQSDRRAKNTDRRVHITLELPWSADRAIQQFGRTHRSNQVNAPEYVFMISDLAGEHRFASIVAKRLESLGALTHGDRRATESRDLSKFHIDTKYGRDALERVMKSVMAMEQPVVDAPKDYTDIGIFFEEVRGALMGVGLIINDGGSIALDKEYNNISKFLNRILGMPVKLQNNLFQYFTDTLHFVVTNAKKTGRFDMGILDLGDSGSGALQRLSVHKFFKKHSTGRGEIELHQLLVERGLSWNDAMEKYAQLNDDNDGFYMLKQRRNDKRVAVLVISEPVSVLSDKKKEKRMYTLYRPSTGLQFRKETWKELSSKYEKYEPEQVQTSWENQYKASEKTCIHAFWAGNCRAISIGHDCDVGRRTREYNVLSGSVLMVWQLVEQVLASRSSSYKMLVVRVRDEKLKLVGVLIPNLCVKSLVEKLIEFADDNKLTEFKENVKECDD